MATENEGTPQQFSDDDLSDLTVLLAALHDLTLQLRDKIDQEDETYPEQMQMLGAWHAGTHYFLDKIPALRSQEAALGLDAELEQFFASLPDDSE